MMKFRHFYLTALGAGLIFSLTGCSTTSGPSESSLYYHPYYPYGPYREEGRSYETALNSLHGSGTKKAKSAKKDEADDKSKSAEKGKEKGDKEGGEAAAEEPAENKQLSTDVAY